MRCINGLVRVICRLAKTGAPLALTLVVAGAPAVAEEGLDSGETAPVAAEKQPPAKVRPRGPYLTAEVGGNWAGASNTSVTLPGFRLSGAAGDNFNRWIGLEL